MGSIKDQFERNVSIECRDIGEAGRYSKQPNRRR